MELLLILALVGAALGLSGRGKQPARPPAITIQVLEEPAMPPSSWPLAIVVAFILVIVLGIFPL